MFCGLISSQVVKKGLATLQGSGIKCKWLTSKKKPSAPVELSTTHMTSKKNVVISFVFI